MERTDAGIDYGNGLVNIDQETGIRYGVISQHEVLQAWADSSEPFYVYSCPYCGNELKKGQDAKRCGACHKRIDPDVDFDMLEPLNFTLDDGEYQAQCGDDGDIFILKSPYFTLCAFCSPCAPGAGYLMSPFQYKFPLETGNYIKAAERKGYIKAYCFGHDWFDGQRAPYPVFKVDTGEQITPDVNGGNEP